MAVSQETLIKKMKEALVKAEQHMHTGDFKVSIGKLHVLCELVLDDADERIPPTKQPVTQPPQQLIDQRLSPSPQVVVDHKKDDSIFDF